MEFREVKMCLKLCLGNDDVIMKEIIICWGIYFFM